MQSVSTVESSEQLTRVLGGKAPQNPSETIKKRGFVAGIMGLPESGKTSTLPTLIPAYAPVADFNIDGGSHVLEDIPNLLKVYTPEDWPNLDQMVTDLEKGAAPFKSLWFDVVTMIQDENIEYYGIYDKTKPQSRERQISFGDSNWDVIGFHRRLLRIAEQQDVNIFLVYWCSRPVVVEGSGSNLATQHIVLSPTVSLKVTGMLDVIFHIAKNEGQNPYPGTFTLQGTSKIETRARLSPNNPLKKWRKGAQPITSTFLTDAVNAFHGELNDVYM